MSVKQKILILATTASMIEQFNIHNIQILQSLGAEVHVGTNFSNPGTITNEISNGLISRLNSVGVKCHQIDFLRGIGNHRANKKAMDQVISVIKKEKITGIHAHSPLGGIIARRAGHKTNTKVMYTAHGLQFFKGGPLKDWLVFFPVEWFYAHWTDALVTINQDDYSISKYLPVSRRYYIPGVGIDLKRLKQFTQKRKNILRSATRKKLNIKNDDFLIISVGELSNRKNHETVIKAIKKLNNPNIKYAIAGIGDKKRKLISLVHKLNLKNQVQLLGYCKNLDGLYYAADLNVFISKREGLGLGGLDGVAHGLYIIGSKNTGMKDYITNENIGLLVEDPTDINEVADKINNVYQNKKVVTDFSVVKKFEHYNVDRKMKRIYENEFFS